ncbi:D-2-hydroxyacid dehydrogenase family protein [Acidisphaera rubrifaciens]|uniref:D-isomer specific 2-hydroxyacid dehydrogenase n=1 Tax=Acidisphaera rubrifaciens HS-AP3 TaxID=1231350 RepID=A0A0D6P920_9PROT|nr:D-2-hydroxyacid dehydrogenase family protein [Acidisphaera rubrifaciens]GAN77364.1 D-isomer specific 2-hydroxyacid dehydrogenase [Acidisphaera rubrifaciens HS-AP3]
MAAGGAPARIAVLDDYQGVARACADWSALDGRADVTVFRDHLDDAEALVARLLPFDVVCVMRERTPLPAPIIARLPNLKLICSTAARNASIDVAAAAARGIPVCNTGYTSHGAAELTWALLLAAARHVPAEAASVRAGGWQTTVGGDLYGHTLGLVGLGRIGAMIGRVGLAFGMEVIAWSQNLSPARAAEVGVRAVDKATLFATADYVSVHLVLSDRSRGIVGADELAGMKPTAWLVNTSRGPLVDEGALIDALRAGRIGGAALDVYDVEPLPPAHPLRTLPNVLATPHVGFVTRDTYAVFYRDTVENIVAWLDGAPIRVTEVRPG